MNFNTFLSRINTIKVTDLEGINAHIQFSPKRHLRNIKPLVPKKAAVLALFYPNKEHQTSILLIERAHYNGTHSSQISFPGGKTEKSDKNLEETALRETFEEVGISKGNIEIIKQLTEVYIPPSNFLVTPFIGFSKQKPLFITNNEVENIIEVLFSDVLNDKNIVIKKISNSYMINAEVPCFQLNNYIVWGATAMMLNEIKYLLK